MAPSLRAALVGFGQVAEKAHVPAFIARGIEIAAVCESNPERLKAARSALPSAKFYESYERLLEAEAGLDFVDLATPPYLHGPQVLAALRAGFHALCEKPLSLAPAELDTLRRTAAMAGRCAFTVHNWAYSPQWLKIYALVHAGAVGDLLHVEAHALRTKPATGALAGDWRREPAQAGGGILVDHGWHNLYLLYRLLKTRPVRVNARLNPDTGPGVEDEASLFMEFPSATALVHLSWRSAIRRNTSLIVGTKGIIELGDDEIVSRTAGVERFSFPEALSAGSAHPEWFSNMLPDFFGEISDASKRGRNLEEASFCLSVIHRAYQSARHGRNPVRAAFA